MIVQVPEFKALSRHGVVTMPALTIEDSAMSIAQLSHGLRHYGKTSARFICHHLALSIGFDEARPFREAFESAMDNLGGSMVGTVDRLILRDLCDDDESASSDMYHLTEWDGSLTRVHVRQQWCNHITSQTVSIGKPTS